MGVVTPEQIGAALKKQKEVGRRLGKVLVEMGLCTENQIVSILSEQLEIKIIQIEKTEKVRYETFHSVEQGGGI